MVTRLFKLPTIFGILLLSSAVKKRSRIENAKQLYEWRLSPCLPRRAPVVTGALNRMCRCGGVC
jgi:hypothetical protein